MTTRSSCAGPPVRPSHPSCQYRELTARPAFIKGHPLRLAGLVSLLSFGLPLASDAAPGQKRIIGGHVPAALARSQPIGQLPATNQLRLAIGLPLRDQAGLQTFLAKLYDPASPSFRQYLTPEAFTDRFGPTEQDY